MLETHRVVILKEDHSEVRRSRGRERVRSSRSAGSYLRLGQFTLIN